jgi:hypothetical protein
MTIEIPILIAIIVFSVFLGILIGVIIWEVFSAGPGRRPTAASLEWFNTSSTHMCPTGSCQSTLSWSIDNWNTDVDILITSEKNGEAGESHVLAQASGPAGIFPFSGNDERIFFRGPGNYMVTLQLQGNVTEQSSRTLEVNLLNDGSTDIREWDSAEAGAGPPTWRTQVTSTRLLGFGDTSIEGDEESQKNKLRFCKGTQLTAIRLVSTSYTLNWGGPPSNDQSMPDDDPNAPQPEEVTIAVLREGGVVVDEYLYQLDGTTRVLPEPISLDESIGLRGTRNSGDFSFYPASVVGWEMELTFVCSG